MSIDPNGHYRTIRPQHPTQNSTRCVEFPNLLVSPKIDLSFYDCDQPES